MCQVKKVSPHDLVNILTVGQPIGNYYTYDNGKFVGVVIGDCYKYIKPFDYKRDCLKWLKAPEIYSSKEWHTLQQRLGKRLSGGAL
jgi:hypothetical protein